MEKWCALRFFSRRGSETWTARFPGSVQRLRIEPNVLDHVRRFRQSKLTAAEAGGQLFGTVTSELVQVSCVSGPHRGDERSRYSFRSDPRAAQREINRFAARGLAYLGEWHTHAEEIPRPSGSDLGAIREIVDRSQLNTSTVVMLIIGLAEPDGDVGVWYVGPSGDFLSLT